MACTVSRAGHKVELYAPTQLGRQRANTTSRAAVSAWQYRAQTVTYLTTPSPALHALRCCASMAGHLTS
jgi:hypothetical protein